MSTLLRASLLVVWMVVLILIVAVLTGWAILWCTCIAWFVTMALEVAYWVRRGAS